MSRIVRIAALLAVFLCSRAWSDTVFVDTGVTDARMAAASRPTSPAKFEIEAADDFILTCPATITHATFIGLIPSTADLSSITHVAAVIYRVFPLDSTDPPSGLVPTRVNSPSDADFLSRDSLASELTFTTSLLSPSFTALNSVQPGGIHPKPGQTTGGNGPITGKEVQFDVTFTTAISLSAGHYFFVPQVELGPTSGDFYWLSAPKPIVPPGTSFSPDLQSWTRDLLLDPDWLRIGTDIVGGTTPPTFNGTFSLSGATTPLGVFVSTSNPLTVPPGVLITPVTFSATGGTGPYTFAETGNLPGLALDASGVLSGIPSQLGEFPITVTATDANGCTGTLAFTIRVGGEPNAVPTLGTAGLALLALALSLAGVFALRR